jgi:hypothetical protein
MRIYEWSLLDFRLIGPITPNPHCMNGSSIVMGCKGIVDFFIFPKNHWQERHFLIIAYDSLKIVGQ